MRRADPSARLARCPTICRLLEAGINVVSTTSTSLVYPPAYFSTEWRDQLEAAAKAGNASFYASGIFPGFASDQLALMLTTQSKTIRTLKVTEIALNDHYPVASVMMDGMGFGRPLDFEPLLKTPGFIEIAWKAPIYLIAAGLGVEVDEVRGSLDRRPTDRDIEVAFGTIEAGTAVRCVRVPPASSTATKRSSLSTSSGWHATWRPTGPTSECDATYRVDIDGDPDIHCAMTMGEAEGHGAGHGAMTAPPCVWSTRFHSSSTRPPGC